MILSDLGMEVIRIEPPEHLNKGDLFREIPSKEAPYYAMLNRGKKSVTLNLKTPKGHVFFLNLVKGADVVLEGFRPGVMQRLGLDYEALKAVNPGVIFASISGYGQKGPYRERAGHDLNYLAYSGILGLNAPAGGGLPVMPPIQIADVGGGTFPAVIGILAALLERRQTGKGRWLDIAMLDGSLFFMGLALFDWGIGKNIAPGKPPISRGSINFNVYETKDGRHLALGALEDNFWYPFCEAIGKPEWKKLFGNEVAMCDETVIHSLRELFLTKTQGEWLEWFRDYDVCLSPVYTFDEVSKDSHVLQRDIFRWTPLSKGKRYPLIHFPVFEGEASSWDNEAPRAGQHTKEVLGLSDEEMEVLKREGVV
jgi:crotonobetainyl-CoA:carnitine CoA-transferase CaiB-like acyl-CoA transferase